MAGGAPTTVVGLTGELADLAKYVRDAVVEIAIERDDWLYLVRKADVTLTIGQGDYDPVTDLGLSGLREWRRGTLRQYDPAVGHDSDVFLTWQSYPAFRDYYRFGSLIDFRGPGIAVTESPEKKLLLGPIPDKAYKLTGEYIVDIAEMAADDDVPGIPERYHPRIVYRALQPYALKEANPELLTYAKAKEAFWIQQMTRNQLQRPSIGGALA